MNLYTALRAGFPADLDATAIDADGALYTWRDLERGSAMLANWLHKLELPAGSRVVEGSIKRGKPILATRNLLRYVHPVRHLLAVFGLGQRHQLSHFLLQLLLDLLQMPP